MTKTKATMKACIRDKSGPDGLLRFGDLPKPTVKKGCVVIKVMAAGVNPADYKMPYFMMKGTAMGYDVAGIVESTSSPLFKEGDKVYGHSDNSIAEYALCQAEHLASKPDYMTWAEAASIPMAYTTCIQAWRDYTKMDIKDKKVLVIGASGGCGIAGVQLAKAMGAEQVVGVCSGKNIEFVKSLGATETVDYNTETALKKFGESHFDVVLDCASSSGAGENYVNSSQKSLKKNGMNVALNGPAWTWIRKILLGWEAKNFALFMRNTDNCGDELRNILSLLGPDFHPTVYDTVYSFDQAGLTAGYKMSISRRARGKVVINVGGVADQA
eukprot:CFRG7469T1